MCSQNCQPEKDSGRILLGLAWECRQKARTSQLTRIVVTMSVRLASESVILLDLSLLPSVMFSPLLEFQIPICTKHRVSAPAGCPQQHLFSNRGLTRPGMRTKAYTLVYQGLTVQWRLFDFREWHNRRMRVQTELEKFGLFKAGTGGMFILFSIN